MSINKQALREAAEKATGAHDRLSVMPADDIFDIPLHEGTQLDADITDLNAFNETANPAAVLALLDELEAAKQDSARWFKAFEKAVSVGARYEERIAELEAREPDLYLCRVTRNGEELYSPCGKDYPRGRGYIAAGIITKVGE